MTGLPLEQTIRDVTKNELSPLGVTVHDRAHKYHLGEDVFILADVLMEKEGYPISLISIKSWIGTTQIRETFAKAYLSKVWNGQKNVRFFMTSLLPIEPRIKRVERICKPYLDGVYSISGMPSASSTGSPFSS